MTAVRTTVPPKLEGLPNEPEWQQAFPATDFTQSNPNIGSPARQRTEVRVLFDDEAVYVGTMLYDTAPDSILSQLSHRDGGQVNADMFSVYFDTYQEKHNAFGFEVSTAGVQTDFKATSNGAQDSIFFGNRTVHTVNNTITGTYIFNARTALNLNMRHYWSNADYKNYYLLVADGNLSSIDYKPASLAANDRNFNAFNIDLVYSWLFAPGSEVSEVWKNAIYNTLLPERNHYFLNLGNTLQAKQLNSFSVKVLYYLDFQEVKRALKS